MTLAAYTMGAFALAGLAFGVGAGTHQVAKGDFNERFGKDLASYDLSVAVRRWPSHFVQLFDSIFGSKHLSWLCLRRSCYCTIVGLGTVTIAYIVFVSVPWSLLSSWSSIWVLVTLNFIPDFFSLLETRWLISRLGRNPSLKKLAGALLLDLILTATIFIVTVAVLSSYGGLAQGLVHWKKPSLPEDLYEPSFWVHLLTYEGGHGYPVMIQLTYCTTFFTSVWVWMLGGSILAAKVLGSLAGPLWRWLSRRFLDMEKKPFLALGWIGAASVILAALVALPVLWITGIVQ